MVDFFNTIFNTLVRDLNPTVKIILVAVFFMLAVMSLYFSIRKKNDSNPIAWGWVILSIVFAAIAIVYIIF